MPAFTFTEDEFKELQRASERLMMVRANLKPKEWKKPEHVAVKRFADKFGPKEKHDADTHYILERVSIKIVLALTNLGIDALRNKIVPEYEGRIAAQPDKQAYYQQYLDKAKFKLSIFEGLREKLEGGL
jgi:hypothetical protein